MISRWLLYTTRDRRFAECQKHSAKAVMHSAKSLPSVTLDKRHSATNLTAKPALPSDFSQALGKSLPCANKHSAT